MGIGITGQHLLLNQFLNEFKAATRSSVIRVDHGFKTKHRGHGTIAANDIAAYFFNQAIGRMHRGPLHQGTAFDARILATEQANIVPI